MEKLNSRKYGMWGVWNNGNTDFVIALLRFCKFSYISKFHILISYKLTIYIVMCFYQGTN